jgi:hypothetical protein
VPYTAILLRPMQTPLPPLYIIGPFYIINKRSFAQKNIDQKKIEYKIVSSVFFMTMLDAFSTVHGSEVNLLAVVAYVGLMKEDPYEIREICVKNNILIFIAIN